MPAPYLPDDDMTAAEEAVCTALHALLGAERSRIRLCQLLAEGETHRPGRRTDLMADIGAARREVEVARRRLDHALSAQMGGEVPEQIFASPAATEASMAGRLGNNLSVAAIEAHVARPVSALPQVVSPAAAMG